MIRQQTISTVSKPGVNVKSMKKGRTASKTVHEGKLAYQCNKLRLMSVKMTLSAEKLNCD